MRVMNPTELGLYVRRIRTESGLTQAELAQRVNTTQAWISEIESGKPRAQIDLVFRLLRTLDVAVDLRTSLDNKSLFDDFRDEVDIDSIADR